jgi:glucokinase
MTDTPPARTPPAPGAPGSPDPAATSGHGLRPWLVADIGGTNARFGWLAEGADTVARGHASGAGHAGPAHAARPIWRSWRKLGQLPRRHAPAPLPWPRRWAATRSRSPTAAGRSRAKPRAATGAGRIADPQRLRGAGAVAAAAAGLRSCAPVGPRTPLAAAAPGHAGRHRPRHGPGRGRPGAHAHGWVALPGEGGHATISAADDFEARCWRRAPPLPACLGRAAAVGHRPAGAARGRGRRGGHKAEPLSTNQIVAAGPGGQRRICSRTVDSFCALLGSFAGNVALTLGARGGVYIGGGIVPRLGRALLRVALSRAFRSQGPLPGLPAGHPHGC